MKLFLSDNCSGIHPRILKAITSANYGHSLPYGEDDAAMKLQELLRELFSSQELKIFTVASGTAANIIGLAGVLHSYEGVICADTAHINTHECGAFEKLTGSKLLPCPNKGGKLDLCDAEKYLKYLGDEHLIQPRAVSISQTTEFGTVYTISEFEKIAAFCKQNDLIFHVDGARLSNALASLKTTPYEMITRTGVNLLSFGGTKNGLLGCDLILSFNSKVSKKIRFLRKQFGHLLSKMRFLSCQFEEYIKDGLYLELALQANASAKYFEKRLREIECAEVVYPVDSNMIFVRMPNSMSSELIKKFPFHIFDTKEEIARFVTSFDTEIAEIDALTSEMERIVK